MRPMFADYGVHALVDGQFGSTGKGMFAAWLAEEAFNGGIHFAGAISNGGPNSGHTFYHNGGKHVLKQLPTFAVKMSLLQPDRPHLVYLTAGAIIDFDILCEECRRYPNIRVYVHPRAVLVSQKDKDAEHSGSVARVAGTRSGAGAALARKVLREPDAVFDSLLTGETPPVDWPQNLYCDYINIHWRNQRWFMEVSQGFSLGYHSEFYPKCTSRECTAAQGIADAQLPCAALTRTFMCLRTYPIRVGNHEGHSSGDCYGDQFETNWESLEQDPELTTVTKRERRVFTWSQRQVDDAIRANQPDTVMLNFANYIKSPEELANRVNDIIRFAVAHGNPLDHILLGYGPESKDVRYA